MKHIRNLALLMLIALNFTSCSVADYAKTLRVEIMMPGIINIPENANTIALVNRFQINNTIPFRYFNETTIVSDTSIKYKALSDTCVSALERFLNKEAYFKKVINYHDSLANLFPSNNSLINPEEIFHKTNSDICIFLNSFDFNVATPFGLGDVILNNAALSWTIAIKTDSLSYVYNQVDTLLYEADDFPSNLWGQKKFGWIVNNSSNYLGRFAGSKIIPTWMSVERLYYKSNNQNMLLAEKYALKNDWLKAAEIWNNQTKNRNTKIAAKACYNMALACEMEGKPDVAIEWLVLSHAILKHNNKGHQANCQRYAVVLALRKKEIEKLEKQIRNN